jgi:hypothetical protein
MDDPFHTLRVNTTQLSPIVNTDAWTSISMPFFSGSDTTAHLWWYSAAACADQFSFTCAPLPAAIDEHASPALSSVFPTLSENDFTLHSPASAQIVVCAIQGRIVANFTSNGMAKNLGESWCSGMYFISVWDGTRRESLKAIAQLFAVSDFGHLRSAHFFCGRSLCGGGGIS